MDNYIPLIYITYPRPNHDACLANFCYQKYTPIHPKSRHTIHIQPFLLWLWFAYKAQEYCVCVYGLEYTLKVDRVTCE